METFNLFKETMVEILENEGIQFKLNGHEKYALPHILNISFPHTDVESLLVNLDMEGLAVSSGSACTAGSIDPSHVLVAMYGEKAEELRNSIRFSFGYGLTMQDIEEAAKKTAKFVKRLVK